MNIRPRSASLLLDLLALLALIAALGALSWSVITVFSLRGDVDAANASADAAAGTAAHLEGSASLASQTAADRATLASLIIPTGGDAALISSLEALAAREHVLFTVTSVNTTAPQGTSTPGTLTLLANLSGSYANDIHFLQLLETEHLALSIPAVSLSYAQGGSTWSGSLTLLVLSYDSP